ncbi:MAG: 16S rRNA (uracil(1498)-N(3))-methyltransferase [Rubrivivax sp.]
MTLRLYVPELALALAADAELALPPGPARHVQVRRAQPGDALVLFDGHGGEWSAEVRRMARDAVHVRVGAHDATEREADRAITVALGMPANERMDALVEKATELGAAAIQPLLCTRAVLRLHGERAARKQGHWQGVAIAAAEQCGRTRVPPIAPVRTLDEWLAGLPPAVPHTHTRWLLSPGAAPLAKVDAAAPTRPAAATLLSGPEGGLTPEEQAAARAAGFVPVGLGARLLRADTAPLAVLAWAALRT